MDRMKLKKRSEEVKLLEATPELAYVAALVKIIQNAHNYLCYAARKTTSASKLKF